MGARVEEAPRHPTPFQLMLRDMRSKKAEWMTAFCAFLCITFSAKLVSLKHERRAVESEHEERMAALKADNAKLRTTVEVLGERIVEEASKHGRKLDPLSVRIDAIFDELVPKGSFSHNGEEKEKAKPRSFFV